MIGYQVDVEEHEPLADQFKIEGLPTLVLFKEGVVVQRFIGVQSAANLTVAIEKVCPHRTSKKSMEEKESCLWSRHSGRLPN